MPTKKGTATTYKSPSGKWNFTLRASNGKIVAHSNQGYERKSTMNQILSDYFPNFETPAMSERAAKKVAKLHKQLAKGRR